jgi:NDP-sugar pyrophosphorylase family protein
MKVLILAAGYGTRLGRDLQTEEGRAYQHLVGLSKPLLPIGGKPLIDHWMFLVQKAGLSEDNVIVVTNAVYYDKFVEWSREFPKVSILNDGTSTNESRLGAISDIALAIKHYNIKDDLTIIGGDTLFKGGFSLSSLWTEYERIDDTKAAGMVVAYQCQDNETVKFGILETDERGIVSSFLEKPLPTATTSRKACPCFYILSKEVLPQVDMFLEEKKDFDLKERDAPGHLIKFLCTRIPLHVWEVTGRYDVGGLQSYIECNTDLSKPHKRD